MPNQTTLSAPPNTPIQHGNSTQVNGELEHGRSGTLNNPHESPSHGHQDEEGLERLGLSNTQNSASNSAPPTPTGPTQLSLYIPMEPIENAEYWDDLWNARIPPSVSMDEYMAYSTGRTSPSATIDEIVTYSSTGYDFFSNVSTVSVSPNANGQPDSTTASLNSRPGTSLARPASALGNHSESTRFQGSASRGAQGNANHGHQLGETRNPRRFPRHTEHRLRRMTSEEREAFWRSFDYSENRAHNSTGQTEEIPANEGFVYIGQYMEDLTVADMEAMGINNATNNALNNSESN
ncbi:hypothetical protein P154DRAFT_349454 [Amniculicola lignicola CBS 123094]|uniref:Uncharacterized protein n=1 Tax=Amniculicola lignicola CBS 123094 TaxID=1392246 RepID=A0A6A5W0B0_9PLEO|nr:hypothetical protein P154DRAFT_349454 [Amniculicola lignicola CBS 123094]